MVVNERNEIIHMDDDMADSYGVTYNVSDNIDDELGLEIVEKPSIFAKYGVECDPDKNSFHASLHRQYHEKGYLSPKQVNALRK